MAKSEKRTQGDLTKLSENEICEIIETTIEDLGLLTQAFEVIEEACRDEVDGSKKSTKRSEKVVLH